MRAVFDTNILIDYFEGIQKAKQEIELYEFKAISIITYLEFMTGINDPDALDAIKKYLNTFHIVEVDVTLAELASKMRQKYKLNPPDALILASAELVHGVLVTRNTKDFSNTLPIVRIPYKL